MPELTRHYDLELTTLSPLHIGSGRELLRGYDFVARDGRTWRIDEDALLDAALGEGEFDEALLRRPAAELLQPSDFGPDSKLFRYTIPGTPSAASPGARVVEQIKNVFDQPYLPGSSLKGALRTLLAWGIHDAEKRKPNLTHLDGRSKRAAHAIEQGLFGQDPNSDWLRALRVRDSVPLSAGDHLALHTVRVYPTAGRDGSGLDVDVEAIKLDTTLRAQITLENYGFESAEAAKLGWRGKRRWIKELPVLGLAHARQRLLTEAEYFKGRGGPSGALRFYDELVNRLLNLPEDTFLLQVGWGAGWESKTLGSSLLRQDDGQFERLLSKYRMTKEQNRRPGDPFPRSRHLALVNGRPALPMGWVEVCITGLEATPVSKALPKPEGAAPGQRTGRLKKFFSGKGFGFIQPDGGGMDIFVHVSGLVGPATELREGQRLSFDVEQAAKGPRAVNVRLIK